MSLSRYEVARLTEAVGDENATTDPLDLRAYEYDAALSRATPDIVLFPTTTAAVVDVVRFCNRKDIPVTARGSGTNDHNSAPSAPSSRYRVSVRSTISARSCRSRHEPARTPSSATSIGFDNRASRCSRNCASS